MFSARTQQRLLGSIVRSRGGCIAAIAVLCIGLGGCVMPMSVTRSFGKEVLLDPMGTTFGWSPLLGGSMQRIAAENLGNHVAILDAISAELNSKGFMFVAEGSPDFWAAYDVSSRDTANPWTGKPMTELTFTITIHQTETQQVFYRGTAFIDMDGTASPEVRMNTLRAAVQRILDHFPRREKNQS
jgi:hypothetical protein